MVNFIQTSDGVHLYIDGKPRSVSVENKQYAELVEALRVGAEAAAILEILDRESAEMRKAVSLSPELEITGGLVYHNGYALPESLSNRIIQMSTEGFSVAPLVRFVDKLMANPSKRVVDHLYAFLEYGKSPLSEDGDFVVYKAVRADFKDIHSGTFDNSVGQVVSMPRNRVNEDPHQTCSAGLHVCSFEYLSFFSHADGHVIVCKVNPADVVAIPVDYNNTKMRVSRYEVIGEVENWYRDRRDELASRSVYSAGEDEVFEVQTYDGDSWITAGSYAALSDAALEAESEVENGDALEVRIVNTETGATVWQQDGAQSSSDDDSDDNSDDDEGPYEARFYLADSTTDTLLHSIEGFHDLESLKAEAETYLKSNLLEMTCHLVNSQGETVEQIG